MGEYGTRILLAVDGSEQSFEAVRCVSELFPPDRLEAVLFHVMSKIPESFWDIEKDPAFRHKLAPMAAWMIQQERLIWEFMERSRQLFVECGVPGQAVSVKILERQAGIARDIPRWNDGKMETGNPIIPILHDSLIPAQWLLTEPKISDLALRTRFSKANKPGL